MEHVLSVSGAVMMSICAFFGIALWTGCIMKNVGRVREQVVRPVHVARVEEWGLMASFATILASLLTGNVLVGNTPFSPAVLKGVEAGSVLLVLLWTVLWGLTFWLRQQARQPSYLYLLPQDAECVRREHCQYGIQLLASMYPLVFSDSDTLDTFSRSVQVSSRAIQAPRWKREHIQLTNDFAVYCNVASEGYQRGYLGLLHACEEDSDQLKTVRMTLKAWPETPESQQAMEHWMTQIMGPEPQAS